MRRTPGRRKMRPARTDRSPQWVWTSQNLCVPQRARLGAREYDTRHPACHYNLHIQPVCGGPDYHNYHIRYLGTKAGQHAWSVVDAPAGRAQSQRIYAVAQERFIVESIDVVSCLLLSDITTDIGDPSLWLTLAEHLAGVLFDVYQHERETLLPGRA